MRHSKRKSWTVYEVGMNLIPIFLIEFPNYIVLHISNVPISATLRLRQKYRERKNETNTSNEVSLEEFTKIFKLKFQSKSFN